MQDRYILQSYHLFDRFNKGAKGRQYRLDRKQDFNAFYILIRVFRDNKIASDKYKAKKKIANDVHLAESGLAPMPTKTRSSRGP